MRNSLALLIAIVGANVCFAQEGPRQGVARGTVITTGEDRVVIERQEAGGQLTLEAGYVKNDAGKFVRNKHQLELIRTLKPGDKIVAGWNFGEGHYMIREMAKLGADGKPVRREAAKANARHQQPKEGGDTARQLHQLKDEVGQLRKEIAELRELLEKLLKEE